MLLYNNITYLLHLLIHKNRIVCVFYYLFYIYFFVSNNLFTLKKIVSCSNTLVSILTLVYSYLDRLFELSYLI